MIFPLKPSFIADFSIATFDSRRIILVYPGGIQIPYDLGNQEVTENFPTKPAMLCHLMLGMIQLATYMTYINWEKAWLPVGPSKLASAVAPPKDNDMEGRVGPSLVDPQVQSL